MEIAVRGILGALIAIAIHFAVRSRHSYLAALIPLFPTFMLMAHISFAMEGRSDAFRSAIAFGLISLLPYATYLAITWWTSLRFNNWLAMTWGIAGWTIVAVIIVLYWIQTGSA